MNRGVTPAILVALALAYCTLAPASRAAISGPAGAEAVPEHGRHATGFQSAKPQAEKTLTEEHQSDEVETDEPQVLGGSAAFSLIDGERERVWVPAGTPIFQHPDVDSLRLEVIDALSEIESIESTEGWHKILFAGRVGWVQPDLPAWERGLEITHEPSMVAVGGADMEIEPPQRRIELAGEALGLTAPNGILGPWALLTDIDDQALLSHLDVVADGLPGSYRGRFGLEPADASEQVVALFASEETYRPFESEASHLAGMGARGHASAELAALFVEGHDLDEASSLVIHELTHLMNRGSLGSDPPPWVEEGIANDLAYSIVDRQGRLRLGSINGDRIAYGDRRSGRSIQYSGGVAALAELLRARVRRRSTPLEALTQLDQKDFLAPARRQLHYIESAFLVRFLLEFDRGHYAQGFGEYMLALGASDHPERLDLLDYVDADWARLERDLESWLQLQASALLR